MRLYLEGDAHAFHEIYRRFSGRVLGYLSKRVASPEEAQDIRQVVFMKFHQVRHQFDFKHSVAQYLFVIARTALIDQRRKQSRNAQRFVEYESTIAFASAPHSKTDAGQSLDWSALGSDQKTALKMRYLDEASYSEIARKLARSEQSVRQLVSRALRQLRLAVANGSGAQKLKRGGR